MRHTYGKRFDLCDCGRVKHEGTPRCGKCTALLKAPRLAALNKGREPWNKDMRAKRLARWWDD